MFFTQYSSNSSQPLCTLFIHNKLSTCCSKKASLRLIDPLATTTYRTPLRSSPTHTDTPPLVFCFVFVAFLCRGRGGHENRDILLSTKRTSSGGDVWVCVDRLCGRRDMVVVCPASQEADPLHVAVEFEPESESEPEPEPPLPGPEHSVIVDQRSSTTDPPSPPISPFRDDDDNSDSSNSDSFPDHHEQRQQKQQQQEVSTLGQGRRAVSRPSALVTSPHSLPGCNCARWSVCPVLDAASVAGAGVGGERGAMSGLARGIVSNPRQKSNPARSVNACCASGMGSDSFRGGGGGGGISTPRCRYAVEETSGSCFWPDESDRVSVCMFFLREDLALQQQLKHS